MTRPAKQVKSRYTRPGAAATVALVGSLSLLLAACPSAGPPSTAAADEDEESIEPVRSRDRVLEVVMPEDLVVHAFDAAIMGTSHDGGFRIRVAHEPEELLIRRAGAAKDLLDARGWLLESEHHFERATELRWRHEAGDGAPEEHRAMWFISRSGRVITCDATANAPSEARLDEPLRNLCQSVVVRPPETPPAAPDGGGASGRAQEPT